MTLRLKKSVLDASPDIFSHLLDGKTVYVKKRRRRKNPLGAAAQAVLHFLTANPLLSPPPGPGGDSAAFEADRLERLAALGVPVPRVLERGDGYFVMSDAGIGLDRLFTRNRAKAERLFPAALAELRRLHSLGQAHGGAQARNITFVGRRAHFIDFEDDIAESALESFQLRDVFLFLFSLERLGADPDLEILCRSYDSGGGTLERLARALAGLRVVKLLDNRLLSSLGMRDIRGLIRLIGKAERLSGSGGGQRDQGAG